MSGRSQAVATEPPPPVPREGASRSGKREEQGQVPQHDVAGVQHDRGPTLDRREQHERDRQRDRRSEPDRDAHAGDGQHDERETGVAERGQVEPPPAVGHVADADQAVLGEERSGVEHHRDGPSDDRQAEHDPGDGAGPRPDRPEQDPVDGVDHPGADPPQSTVTEGR